MNEKKIKLKQRNLIFDLRMSALNYNWYEVLGDMQPFQVASYIYKIGRAHV